MDNTLINEYSKMQELELAPPPPCQPKVSSSTQVANSYSGAKRKAKKDWKNKVKSKYGKSWKKWGKAKNKNWSCYAQGRKAACAVTAEPCK